MISKNPFLKYVMKENKEDIFHSSAYAKAQSGENMGAASSESYQVRVNINQNRTKIRGYNESELMAGTMKHRPKAETIASSISSERLGGAMKSSAEAAASRAQVARAPKKPGFLPKR